LANKASHISITTALVLTAKAVRAATESLDFRELLKIPAISKIAATVNIIWPTNRFCHIQSSDTAKIPPAKSTPGTSTPKALQLNKPSQPKAPAHMLSAGVLRFPFLQLLTQSTNFQ
jgi:hypothetical protein